MTKVDRIARDIASLNIIDLAQLVPILAPIFRNIGIAPDDVTPLADFVPAKKPRVSRSTIFVIGARVQPDGQYRQKIQMIKLIRTITGWGLKEAKDAVDNVEQNGEPIVLRPIKESERYDIIRDIDSFGYIVRK